jgi:UDP-N-acetylglucosamine--N-acetylmuramyl-(pentapeptide) pyrophosphoryl-undecaprenol N-acetylglucosamine transferase
LARLVFTGGGSAGHVIPALPVLDALRDEGHDVHWIGSRKGLERALLEGRGVPYGAVTTGKLRRYLSVQNLIDALRVPFGVLEALVLLLRLRPALVFSKGGFVAVPVVLAAAVLRIPVVLHESDRTPGLANRICAPFARTVLATFPDTAFRPRRGQRQVVTGAPVRPELLAGDRARGLAFAGFDGHRPVLLVMGGSLGAEALNGVVRDALPELLRSRNVVHLCGRGRTDPSLQGVGGYRQFEFVGPELGDLLAAADTVVSRAGATALLELLALRLPHLLVPLPRTASRGDQLENATWSAGAGFSRVVHEADLDPRRLLAELRALDDERGERRAAMAAFDAAGATERVLAELRQVLA